MGDAGALLVGLLMATSAIAITGQVDPAAVEPRRQLLPGFIPILLPVAILIIPLLDFGLAVFRRMRAGKSPFSADRKHLHHRLLDMGHTHLHAVLIFYAWTAAASIGCLLYFVLPSTSSCPPGTATVFLVVGADRSAPSSPSPRSAAARPSRPRASCTAGRQTTNAAHRPDSIHSMRLHEHVDASNHMTSRPTSRPAKAPRAHLSCRHSARSCSTARTSRSASP